VILGIDNIIFISILADKLPDHQRNKLRFWGIGLAMVMRLSLLLAFISWILKLDQTLFTAFEINFSGKSLILILGGLYSYSTKARKRFTINLKLKIKKMLQILKSASFKRLLAGSNHCWI
jgi:predicted tellurium resistance membrane protein TerC